MRRLFKNCGGKKQYVHLYSEGQNAFKKSRIQGINAHKATIQIILSLAPRGENGSETMGTGMDQRTERDSRKERLSLAICQVKYNPTTELFRSGVAK